MSERSNGIPQFWVWVFEGNAGLDFVVQKGFMAFSSRTRRRVWTISQNDRAVLYLTARGQRKSCVVGTAIVEEDLHSGDPIEIPGVVGRTFDRFCAISPKLMMPPTIAPEVRELVPRLELVRDERIWGQYFRGSPISISQHDYEIFESALMKKATAR